MLIPRGCSSNDQATGWCAAGVEVNDPLGKQQSPNQNSKVRRGRKGRLRLARWELCLPHKSAAKSASKQQVPVSQSETPKRASTSPLMVPQIKPHTGQLIWGQSLILKGSKGI